MSLGGHFANVVGHNGGRLFLATVDRSALQSPIQGGAIDLDAGQASQVGLPRAAPHELQPRGPAGRR